MRQLFLFKSFFKQSLLINQCSLPLSFALIIFLSLARFQVQELFSHGSNCPKFDHSWKQVPEVWDWHFLFILAWLSVCVQEAHTVWHWFILWIFSDIRIDTKHRYIMFVILEMSWIIEHANGLNCFHHYKINISSVFHLYFTIHPHDRTYQREKSV